MGLISAWGGHINGLSLDIYLKLVWISWAFTSNRISIRWIGIYRMKIHSCRTKCNIHTLCLSLTIEHHTFLDSRWAYLSTKPHVIVWGQELQPQSSAASSKEAKSSETEPLFRIYFQSQVCISHAHWVRKWVAEILILLPFVRRNTLNGTDYQNN